MYRTTIKRRKNKGSRKGRKSIKHGGGLFDWFNRTKPTTPPKSLDSILDDRDQLQSRADNAYMGTNTAVVATGVITALTASGVGIPVAALLAGALLIANKMFELTRSNLLLRLLMKDAIFIIMDSYSLYKLIQKSYSVIGTQEVPNIRCVDNVTKDHGYQINKNMESQLIYQITKLINVLIHLMDTNTLGILKEHGPFGDAFQKALNDEYAKRQKEAGYFSMNKMTRNFDRNFGGSYYIAELTNILTITNSYIVLLKSHLDTVLKKFEILAPDKYKIIWGDILCSDEYNSYIKPVPGVILNGAATDANKANPNTLSEARNTVESDDKVAKRQAIVDNAIELMPLQSRPTAV